LVRANETSIRLVAEELQRRRALSGEEIDGLEEVRPAEVRQHEVCLLEARLPEVRLSTGCGISSLWGA
jgi:hypothetical protein